MDYCKLLYSSYTGKYIYELSNNLIYQVLPYKILIPHFDPKQDSSEYFMDSTKYILVTHNHSLFKYLWLIQSEQKDQILYKAYPANIKGERQYGETLITSEKANLENFKNEPSTLLYALGFYEIKNSSYKNTNQHPYR